MSQLGNKRLHTCYSDVRLKFQYCVQSCWRVIYLAVRVSFAILHERKMKDFYYNCATDYSVMQI
jgi:hypothetical protein